jgi:hypothetical protein
VACQGFDDHRHVSPLDHQHVSSSFTGIFELQRVDLRSELEEQHIDNNLVANVIYEVATRTFFPDHRSSNILLDLETHLRLLASAIRLYKYNGKSLDQQIYEKMHQGITQLSNVLASCKTRTNGERKIEEWNSSFLIKHCQYLLLSIDGTESLGRAVARRAIIAFDGALASAGQ